MAAFVITIIILMGTREEDEVNILHGKHLFMCSFKFCFSFANSELFGEKFLLKIH